MQDRPNSPILGWNLSDGEDNEDEEEVVDDDEGDMNVVEVEFQAKMHLLGQMGDNPEYSWRRFCEFAKLDPAKTSVNLRIPFPLLKKEVFPFQYYFVFWALEQCRSKAGGGFNADGMGLGKTLETIAHITMEHVLCGEILRSRELATTVGTCPQIVLMTTCNAPQ
ncbi:MAG: hypothetical protein M4579_007592, partial [Chaenotheca gracillima]